MIIFAVKMFVFGVIWYLWGVFPPYLWLSFCCCCFLKRCCRDMYIYKLFLGCNVCLLQFKTEWFDNRFATFVHGYSNIYINGNTHKHKHIHLKPEKECSCRWQWTKTKKIKNAQWKKDHSHTQTHGKIIGNFVEHI